MRTAWASSLKPLGACLLAVMLCAGLALPAHAITANTSVIPSAVTVTKETAYRGVFGGGAEAHTGLFCQEDPVDGYDPSGLYTQKFGYAVEKLIRAKYALEHSGQDVNRTGGPIGAGNNPALRPDIWNKSSNPKTYAEIKPLSISGIAHGIGQLNTYERSLKDFGYVRDKWPSGIRTDYYNCQPFFYFNINGLILYTTIEPLVVPALFPAAKALAESQAAQLAKGVVTTLNDVVGKEAMQAVEASSLEVEDGVATVALTEDL